MMTTDPRPGTLHTVTYGDGFTVDFTYDDGIVRAPDLVPFASPSLEAATATVRAAYAWPDEL